MASGRPMVLLLHPSIIAEHVEVLHRFIAYVREQGGDCLSFEQYRQTIMESTPSRTMLRLDPRTVDSGVNGLVRRLTAMQITDAYVLTRDVTDTPLYGDQGQDVFGRVVRPLTKAGIRTHAWLPALQNDSLARAFPDQAMVDSAGKASTQWLSPSSPDTRQDLQRDIRFLLDTYPLAGIHLDGLRYPSIQYDYSAKAIRALVRDTGLEINQANAASLLPIEHYDTWIRWRFNQLDRLASAAAAVMVDRNKELSVAIDAQGMTDFKYMEMSGQDSRRLASHVDTLVAMLADQPQDTLDLTRLADDILTARFMVGRKTLLLGLGHQADAATTDSRFRQQLFSVLDQGCDGLMFTSSEGTSDGPSSLPGLFAASFRPGMEEDILPESAPVAPASTPPAQSPPEPSEPPMAEATVSQSDQASPWIPLTLGIGLLSMAGFLGVRYVRHRHLVNEMIRNREETVMLDWQTLDETILTGEVSGMVAHVVAKHLHVYDPGEINRYRMALVMETLAQSEEGLSLEELQEKDMDMPGWPVLAKSHLQEALQEGLIRQTDHLYHLSPSGTKELAESRAKGFDWRYWCFVERRLHESLLATCPYCRLENTTHWYWSSFTCSKCKTEVALKNCTTVRRATEARFALSQHTFA